MSFVYKTQNYDPFSCKNYCAGNFARRGRFHKESHLSYYILKVFYLYLRFVYLDLFIFF